jgi:flavin-dependent dehydrogenase
LHDILIVGAGPAGAVAATVLARVGVRVLVLERARFPRDKLCGDTLNPGALGVLSRLGLAHVAAGALPLDGMLVTGDRGARVAGRYESLDGRPLQGRSLSRRDLDAALAHAASRSGAQIDEDVLVREPLLHSARGPAEVSGVVIRGADGRPVRIRAKLVIAADGRYSRLGRALRLSRAARRPRRWAIGAYFDGISGLTSLGEMHVRRTHYVGVAPLPGGLANACVVLTDVHGRSPGAILRQSIDADPVLRDRFTDARMVGEPVCLGPLAIDCAVAGAPGLLLAGDAAGFVDPMTGDGLRFAFRGGELAAIEALRTLEDGAISGAHVRLAATRAREFAHKWRFNRSLRLLVAHPGAVRVAGYAAAIAPGMFRRAIRYAGDVHAA